MVRSLDTRETEQVRLMHSPAATDPSTQQFAPCATGCVAVYLAGLPRSPDGSMNAEELSIARPAFHPRWGDRRASVQDLRTPGNAAANGAAHADAGGMP